MSVVKIEVAHCALDKAGMKNPLVEKCSYSKDGRRSENLVGGWTKVNRSANILVHQASTELA